jgi:hypothetical protein
MSGRREKSTFRIIIETFCCCCCCSGNKSKKTNIRTEKVEIDREKEQTKPESKSKINKLLLKFRFVFTPIKFLPPPEKFQNQFKSNYLKLWEDDDKEYNEIINSPITLAEKLNKVLKLREERKSALLQERDIAKGQNTFTTQTEVSIQKNILRPIRPAPPPPTSDSKDLTKDKKMSISQKKLILRPKEPPPPPPPPTSALKDATKDHKPKENTTQNKIFRTKRRAPPPPISAIPTIKDQKSRMDCKKINQELLDQFMKKKESELQKDEPIVSTESQTEHQSEPNMERMKELLHSLKQNQTKNLKNSEQNK